MSGRDGRGCVNHASDRASYRLSCRPRDTTEPKGGRQAGVTPVCAPKTVPPPPPRQHRVQIGERRLLPGRSATGVIQFSVFGRRGDCVLTSVNPSTYRSAKIRRRLTTASRESTTCMYNSPNKVVPPPSSLQSSIQVTSTAADR